MRAEYFATTAKGVEDILAAELNGLGMSGVTVERGGVRFGGGMADCWRANLWLRTASRVLMPVAEFPCSTPEDLYAGVRTVAWQKWLTPDMTMAVDCSLRDSDMTHSGFVALKTKDAIVDTIRDLCGRRPDVDTRDPDLRVNIHLVKNHCTVSLDTSGTSLDKRGYRLERTEAPLRETLAAAIVMLTGWDGSVPLVDPMCGSGTILIEAALMAAHRAPGLNRGFGFQRWPDFDEPIWKNILEEARQQSMDTLPARLWGGDVDSKALSTSRYNAERAGVAGFMSFTRGDVRDFTPPPGPGVLVCNPPYGERLGEVERLKGLYREIGDTLKQRCKGYTAWIFTGNPDLAKSVGLKASRRIVLFNGPIECRLLKYELY